MEESGGLGPRQPTNSQPRYIDIRSIQSLGWRSFAAEESLPTDPSDHKEVMVEENTFLTTCPEYVATDVLRPPMRRANSFSGSSSSDGDLDDDRQRRGKSLGVRHYYMRATDDRRRGSSQAESSDGDAPSEEDTIPDDAKSGRRRHSSDQAAQAGNASNGSGHEVQPPPGLQSGEAEQQSPWGVATSWFSAMTGTQASAPSVSCSSQAEAQPLPPGLVTDPSHGQSQFQAKAKAAPKSKAKAKRKKKASGSESADGHSDRGDGDDPTSTGKSAPYLLASALKDPNHWSLALPSTGAVAHRLGACIPCENYRAKICYAEKKCRLCHDPEHFPERRSPEGQTSGGSGASTKIAL